MTAVSVVQEPPTPVGVARAGPPGKGWTFGEGPPDDIVGRIGEMYLDTDPEGPFNAYGPKPGTNWAGAQVHPLGAESAASLAAQAAAEAAAALAEGHATETASDRAAVAIDAAQVAADRALVDADKVAAVSAKDAAESAAESATDDAAATAADRTAVATDRTAVATDAGQVAADRAAVELAAATVSDDAEQTAADRTQTGLDRAAAEAAATAAATFDPDTYYTKTASDSRNATTAQGAKADTAVQPSSFTAKTANYTVLSVDRNAVIGASNSITLALTAAATLGNGFSFSVRNVGTGVVTIDPNSAELIDGRSTILVYPGEAFDCICTGTAWITRGRIRGVVYLGSFTVGSSVASIDFTLGFNDSEITAVSVYGTSIVKASSSRLMARVSKAATFATTLYQGTLMFVSGAGVTTQTPWSEAPFSGNAIPLGSTVNTADHSFELHLSSIRGNFPTIRFAATSDGVSGGTAGSGPNGTGSQATSGAVDGLRILASTGNITGGTFHLYGTRL